MVKKFTKHVTETHLSQFLFAIPSPHRDSLFSYDKRKQNTSVTFLNHGCHVQQDCLDAKS